MQHYTTQIRQCNTASPSHLSLPLSLSTSSKAQQLNLYNEYLVWLNVYDQNNSSFLESIYHNGQQHNTKQIRQRNTISLSLSHYNKAQLIQQWIPCLAKCIWWQINSFFLINRLCCSHLLSCFLSCLLFRCCIISLKGITNLYKSKEAIYWNALLFVGLF